MFLKSLFFDAENWRIYKYKIEIMEGVVIVISVIKRLVKECEIIHYDAKLAEIELNELCKFVVDDQGCYIGIISLMDLQNGIANNQISAGDACNRNATILSEPMNNEVFQQALSIFDSTSLYYIPILSSIKKPVGFFLNTFLDPYPNSVIDADMTFLEIIYRLRESHQLLYVVCDNKLIGIIGKRELDCSFMYTDLNSLTAGDICKKEFEYTTFETFADDVERLSKFSSWPFIDAEGNLVYIMYRDALENLRSWNDSQDFEINFWKQRLQKKDVMSKPGHTWYDYNQLLRGNSRMHDILINCWKDKTCLEIGAGPLCGYVGKMTEAKRRIVIEPLADRYHLLRTELLINLHGIDGIEFYSKPADYFIPALKNSIDGLIISRNALDHTPNWCFILSNISLYAQKGTYFYLWTDILHTVADPIGHYNITPDANQFLRLVESFGFEILYSEMSNNGRLRQNLCITVFAIKR